MIETWECLTMDLISPYVVQFFYIHMKYFEWVLILRAVFDGFKRGMAGEYAFFSRFHIY